MTLYDVHRELVRGEYCCIEYPHVALHFLPTGALRVYGEQPQPIMHTYSITHRNDKWIMETVPCIMITPGEMQMEMRKGNLVLKNTILDKDNKSIEELNFTKFKFKGF